MIYITGDTHGDLDIIHLSKHYFNKHDIRMYTKDDIIIVLGDFGFPFYSKEYRIKYKDEKNYRFWTGWLSELPCQILYIDGNHDNHPEIYTFEEVEFAGGIAHQHPDIPNCKHLIRGEVYTLEGHTFFCFGGAASTDKALRKPDIEWWSTEQATEEEFEHAKECLKKYDNKVDYVLTHTMPLSLIRANGYNPVPDKTANFLDIFYNEAKGKDEFGGIDFKEWFCGHFHENRVFGKKLKGLYYGYELIESAE